MNFLNLLTITKGVGFMPLKPKSKKRGSKSASFEENFTGSEKDLSDYIRASAKYLKVQPPADDDEAFDRISDMFEDCAENNSVPTVEKLALCLGVDRDTMFDWQKKGTKGVQRAVMIKRAKEIIASIDAEAVLNGKLNTICYLFRAKNYYGMSDNVTIEHKAATPLGDSQDQSMLVGALLKQLQGQGQATIEPPQGQATIAQAASDFRRATMIDVPSDYAAEGQATMPSDYETSSDYQTTMPETASDYEPDQQVVTAEPLTALQKALAEELTAGAAGADGLELGAAEKSGGSQSGRG
jgi:hypothetical protein